MMRDMTKALNLLEKIKNDPRDFVKYRDSRPIADLKQMLETSCTEFAENVCFMVKDSHDQPYRNILYKEVLEDVNGLGTALHARGLAGKRIAVIGANSYRWAESWLAVVCGTGIMVPLDKESSLADLGELVAYSECECVIFDKKYQTFFTELRDSGKTKLQVLICMQEPQGAEGVLDWQAVVDEGKALVAQGDRSFLDVEIDPEAMVELLFTSGTTGFAKGVMISNWNIAADLMVSPTVLEVTAQDIFFSILPLHHTYECTCGFLMPFYKGAAIAYCEGLRYIAANLQEVRPTFFLGVPMIFENLYKMLIKNIRKSGREKDQELMKAMASGAPLSQELKQYFMQYRMFFGGRMKMIISGGAAIDPNVLEGIFRLGITALQGYGLTEAAPMGALNPDTAPVASSVGVAFPGFAIRIDEPDEEGVGEICLKGDNLMLGYYENAEATAEVMKDGWFYTGDLGRLDAAGYLYITGRKKSVIIAKNGKNVYPEELESKLAAIPLVSESMVWDKKTNDGEDAVIVATVKVSEEAAREMLGEGYTDDQVLKALWDGVDRINADAPLWRQIRRITLKKTEFVKSSSQKIKRFVEENKF